MYILFTILFFFLLLSTALYFTRSSWIPLLPHAITDFNTQSLPFSHYFYTPLSSSFNDDIESGLSSDAFDLHANVAGGDSRAGLDDDAKREIQKLMKGSWLRGPMSFDDARKVYMERRFEREGISRDGRPRDPKFVSFS